MVKNRLAAAFVALGVLVALAVLVTRRRRPRAAITAVDRKSTRLNSSH